MSIPFSPPYIDNDTITAVVESLRSGWITTGPVTRELESELGLFCNVTDVLAVNSATSGLMLALKWFDVGPGDEVILPAYTYAATALSVMNLGAKPVMIDCSDDLTLNPNLIEKFFSSRTKAIIPVDVAGLPCNYSAIRKLINSDFIKDKFRPSNEKQSKLGRVLLLSDSAHSIGSKYVGKPTSLQSDISVLSFHAVKNVTSAEGGAVVLNLPKPFKNSGVYAELKLQAMNGQTKDALTKARTGNWKYDIVVQGFKMNMPDVLAAIALQGLKKYKSVHLARRKEICGLYSSLFNNTKYFDLPIMADDTRESSYHYFPIFLRNISLEQRDEIIRRIGDDGITVNVHYQPLPLLTLFKGNGYNIQDYPNSARQYKREISLPVYPQLTNDQVERIVHSLNAAYNSVI